MGLGVLFGWVCGFGGWFGCLWGWVVFVVGVVWCWGWWWCWCCWGIFGALWCVCCWGWWWGRVVRFWVSVLCWGVGGVGCGVVLLVWFLVVVLLFVGWFCMVGDVVVCVWCFLALEKINIHSYSAAWSVMATAVA
ncbi:hypothetical protein RA272_27765, partial [Pseudomonas syringae pv. tagetis]